jgi:hypothetical protein
MLIELLNLLSYSCLNWSAFQHKKCRLQRGNSETSQEPMHKMTRTLAIFSLADRWSVLVIRQDSRATCRKNLETVILEVVWTSSVSPITGRDFETSLREWRMLSWHDFQFLVLNLFQNWRNLPSPLCKRNFTLKITMAEVQAVLDNKAPSAVQSFHLSNLSFTLKNE